MALIEHAQWVEGARGAAARKLVINQTTHAIEIHTADGATLLSTIGPETGTVTRENITGAATLDVTGHVGAAAELTLTGDVTSLAFTGWDTDITKYQKIRVAIIQDATGGHVFDWRGVEGIWAENPPDTLDEFPGAVVLRFTAETDDAGATVYLDPLDVTYVQECTFADGIEVEIGDVPVGGAVTIAHPFNLVTSVELVRQEPIGRRVEADWWQQDAVPSAPVNIDFEAPVAPVAAGELKARLAGKLATPCALTATVSLWDTAILAVNNAATLQPTITHGGQLGDVQIIPGDGTAPINVDSGVQVNHTYASAYSGDVILRWRRGLAVTEINDSITPWVFNLAALPRALTRMSITAATSATTGNIADLPAGVTYYRNQGSNTTSGDIGDNKLPANLTYYRNLGSNTTSGDIGDNKLPAALTFFDNQGLNTTSGDIGDGKLPTDLTYYDNRGSNTCTYSAGGGLTSINNRFTSHPNPGHTTAEVDLILADLVAANQTPVSDRVIDLTGANQPPTSNADVLVLQGNGWTTVSTN